MAQYANSAAQVLPTSNVPRETPLLEMQANRLNGHAQEMDLAATRLHALADRLLGPLPPNPEKVGTAAIAQAESAMWKLNGAHEWAVAAGNRLRTAIERLEVL